eukprot:6420744-Prymnesium_polylepis.1
MKAGTSTSSIACKATRSACVARDAMPEANWLGAPLALSCHSSRLSHQALLSLVCSICAVTCG